MYIEEYHTDNRDKAINMVEEGRVSADHLLLCCLIYMSNDDVYDMLDANELTDRFAEEQWLTLQNI